MANLPSPDPRFVQALRTLEEAVQCQRLGQIEEADRLYERVLKKNPNYFDALNFFGLFKYQQGKLNDALKLFTKASAVNPRSVNTLNNLGTVLSHLKRDKESLAAFERALALDLYNVQALNNRGNALASLNRLDDAIASFGRAIAIQPTYADAHINCGRILCQLKRYEEALISYDRALAVTPMNANIHHDRAAVLKTLKQTKTALVGFDRALALKPDYADAWNGRASVLYELKCYNEAIFAYDKALAIKPDHADAWVGHGNVLFDLKRYDQALLAYDKAIATKPDLAAAWFGRGNIMFVLGRYDEALSFYGKALAIKPDLDFLAGTHLYIKLLLCDWSDYDNTCARLLSAVQAEHLVSMPFHILAVSSSADDQLKCAQISVADRYPAPARSYVRAEPHLHDRIRIAYLSADFRDHPVAHLCAQLFELHDRRRFEVIGVSCGSDDRSDLRARLVKAFDRFHDVRLTSDDDAAKILNDLHIDIAVDLTGHTLDSRFGILAHRPAPIQVSYLGYPGTMGASFIDYIIADRFVIPPEQQQHYSEKVVYLPDTFQANDSKRPVPRDVPLRAAVGLPDNAFVFCCFNNSYKVTPAIFDIWMRLLREVEGSVLWMLASDANVERNLRHEADKRGIASHRIILAPRVRYLDYLAQYQLADLFLDTIPFNGGTTASDALWSGLPIVTCCGEAFAARMAGSLLNAVGLPELVTTNLADYEALALKLAREPAMLAEIKAKLARNRDTYPLFDTARFTRHIESAYTNMWERWQRGEAPQSFSVAPIQT